ncbi:MAG: hypothetical protein KDB94_11405 [Acidobacteria bacterium]|nr:hypothetical protein [Acidobacteriota bacterium]
MLSRRLLTLALASTLVPAGAVALAAEEPAAPVPVATLFDRPIFLSDLAPREESVETLDADALREARAERLRARVWRAVLDDYASRRDVEPTEAEITSHIENGRRIAARLTRANEERRASIAVELAAADLAAGRRAQLEKELAALDVALAGEAARQAELQDPERRAARESVERRIARQWVRKWKLEQALFRDFGGRIAFQQAGWEPIDAYRALLRRYEADGKFGFPDASWRPAVYAYFDRDFVTLDAEHGRFYFEKPWWERSAEELRSAGF